MTDRDAIAAPGLRPDAWERAVDALGVPMLVVDPTGTVSRANAAAVQDLLPAGGILAGRSLDALLPLTSAGRWTDILALAPQGGGSGCTTALLGAGEGSREVMVSVGRSPQSSEICVLLHPAGRGRSARRGADAQLRALAATSDAADLPERLRPLLLLLEAALDGEATAWLQVLGEEDARLAPPIVTPGTSALTATAYTGRIAEGHALPACHAILDQQMVHVPELARVDPGAGWAERWIQAGFVSCLCVPVAASSSPPLGVLTVWFRVAQPRLQTAIAAATSVARSAALVIERFRLQGELDRRRRVLDLIAALHADIGDEHDPNALLGPTLEALLGITGAKSVCAVYPEAGAGASAWSHTRLGDDDGACAGHPPLGSALAQRTLLAGDVVRMADVKAAESTEPDQGGLGAGVRSYLAVPMPCGASAARGAIFLTHPQPHHFTRLHEELAGNVAVQAGIALANVVDYQRVRRRVAGLAEEDRRKSRILATLGHELRNPLGAIATSLAVFEEMAPQQPGLRRALDITSRQCRHMRRLVDDLLDLSRLTTGTVRLQKRTVEMQETLRDAVADVGATVEARRQTVHLDLSESPLLVRGDPVRLEQVLVNLLSNASRHSPADSRIDVKAHQIRGRCEIRVRDHGRGIPRERLEDIFQPFVQTEESQQDQQGGLGIGLALVRELVDLHGGHVEARSSGPGSGSEFVVRLPLLPAASTPGDGKEGVDAKRASDSAARTERPRRRILIVEDQPDAREALFLLLRRWGHEVRATADAPSALEATRTFRPDVVILDIGLPEIDGWALARRLRQGIEGQTLILALTGLGRRIDRQRSREAGIDAHLVKPVDPEELRRRLEHDDSTCSTPAGSA